MCTRNLDLIAKVPQNIPDDCSPACFTVFRGRASTRVSEPGTRMFKCLSLPCQLLLFSVYFCTKQLRVQKTSCVCSLSIEPQCPVNCGHVTLYYCKWLSTVLLPTWHHRRQQFAAPNHGQHARGLLDQGTNQKIILVNKKVKIWWKEENNGLFSCFLGWGIWSESLCTSWLWLNQFVCKRQTFLCWFTVSYWVVFSSS